MLAPLLMNDLTPTPPPSTGAFAPTMLLNEIHQVHQLARVAIIGGILTFLWSRLTL